MVERVSGLMTMINKKTELSNLPHFTPIIFWEINRPLLKIPQVHLRQTVIYVVSGPPAYSFPTLPRYEDDDQQKDGTIKFAPFYPYYFLGNK